VITSILREYGRLGRLEFAGFLYAPAVGALSVVGSNLQFLDFALLTFITMVTSFWAFIHNDYCDIELDKLSDELGERPLVKGAISREAAWYVIVCCLVVNTCAAWLLSRSVLAVSTLLASVVLAMLYNTLSKKLVGSDVLFASSTALLCLFGALAVSDEMHGLEGISALTCLVVSVKFMDHLVFNIGGALKDIANDRNAGATTFPIWLGVGECEEKLVTKRFKVVVVLLKLISIALIFTPFLFFDLRFAVWQLPIVVLLALRSVIYTVKTVNVGSLDRSRIGYCWVNQELAGKALLPLVLLGHIGMPWTLVLLFGPPAWFLILSYVLYGRFFALSRAF
jgi:4-hydroxybenzoate polyprenyltransferase